MAQQGALHTRSPAEAYSAGNTTQSHRAWSLSVPAGTPQETTQGLWRGSDRPPVRRAGRGSKPQHPKGASAP